MKRMRFSRWPGRVQGMTWGVLCALVLFGWHGLNLTTSVERFALDTLYRARGARLPSPRVAIVDVDADTVARYNWPLKRNLYGTLVERLTRAGASTIAFDILFYTPTDQDAEFARACAQSGRVVQAGVFHVPDAIDNWPRGSNTRLYPFSARFALQDSKTAQVSSSANQNKMVDLARNAIGSFSAQPALQKSATALGHVTVFPELDTGALRRIPNLIRYQERLYPSLALAAAAHALQVKPQEIRVQGHNVTLGEHKIPVDENGETLVNWIGGYRSFNTFSMAELLSDDPAVQAKVLNPTYWKNRVVVVGTSAAGTFEHHATPFSPSQPAMELQANAIDDILSARSLIEMGNWWQVALLLSCALVTGILCGGNNARATVLWTLSISLAIWLLALWLFQAHNLYWPVGVPLLCVLFTGIGCTIYQQMRDARALSVAEERYALAARGANDGIWDWNLQTNTIYYSERWKQMCGYGDEEISERPEEWLNRVHVADRELLRTRLDDHRAGDSKQFECEFRMQHRDGSYLWMLARGMMIVDENHRPARMAGSLSDITKRRQAEQQLLKQALSDELTELPNRTLFLDRLQRAIARSRRRNDYKFGVLFLDLDRFKVVNDSLGHLVGDQMLQTVARRLEACLRPGDTVARLGGDEFTMLIDDIADASDVVDVAERVQNALAQPLELDNHDFATTASIGIAIAQSVLDTDERSYLLYENAQDLLRDADTAMYRAKAGGRASYVLFDATMHAQAVAQLRLETELRRAIERQNFEVWYQPIIEISTGQLSGFEALARWNDPARGLVSPAEFIAYAEESGLIVALDQWVLSEACRQTRRWQERFNHQDLTISINLSGRHFGQSTIVQNVRESTRESGLNAECVRLEITESAVMHNASASADTLQQLRALGFRLSIDDFGTGYSSLSYLHQFPLDVLKIDRSFITHIGADGSKAEIVETVINLARSLNMKVVAEGVETQIQLDQLTRLGCDFAQGYLFSRPLSAEKATELIQSGARFNLLSGVKSEAKNRTLVA